MTPAPREVSCAYLTLLEQAMVRLRFRIRMGEVISQEELHDFLDALHNIPAMLSDYGSGGGWFVEENIDGALQHYDNRWPALPGSSQRFSLTQMLERIRSGEQDQANITIVGVDELQPPGRD